MIPNHQSLCKFHLALVPVSHVDAMTACENEVWEEMGKFKSSLRKTFKKMKKRPLYVTEGANQCEQAPRSDAMRVKRELLLSSHLANSLH